MAQPPQLALKAPLAATRQFSQRWRAFAPRERLGITLAGIVLGALLLWLFAIQPAWHTVRAAPAQLAQMEAQLQQMQRLAAESRELRSAAPISTTQAAQALRTATQRLGTRASVSLAGDRATVTLTGVSGSELSAWLNEARSAARARPLEAQLTRTGQNYSGRVIVALGGRS